MGKERVCFHPRTFVPISNRKSAQYLDKVSLNFAELFIIGKKYKNQVPKQGFTILIS